MLALAKIDREDLQEESPILIHLAMPVLLTMMISRSESRRESKISSVLSSPLVRCPGDVVDIKQPKDTPIYLNISGRRWFDGRMGIYNKQIEHHNVAALQAADIFDLYADGRLDPAQGKVLRVDHLYRGSRAWWKASS